MFSTRNLDELFDGFLLYLAIEARSAGTLRGLDAGRRAVLSLFLAPAEVSPTRVAGYADVWQGWWQSLLWHVAARGGQTRERFHAR